MTSPVAIYKPEPQYSEQARAAKWQGAVLVSVVIDATGTPTNIKVVRPLGLGLDEQAIEAVHQWKFQPGTKDGVPVPVQAQIEVAFRLPQP
jgi:protein TonB